MTQYKQEELWELFNVLPKELKQTIFSENTSNLVREIAAKYELEEEQIPELAGLIGNVLMGLLAPNELPQNITENVKIEKEKSEAITKDFIEKLFYPLKDYLGAFYPNVKFAPGGEKVVKTIAQTNQNESLEKKIEIAQKNKTLPAEQSGQGSSETPESSDTYREPV